jgi:hypothetical protein
MSPGIVPTLYRRVRTVLAASETSDVGSIPIARSIRP